MISFKTKECKEVEEDVIIIRKKDGTKLSKEDIGGNGKRRRTRKIIRR